MAGTQILGTGRDPRLPAVIPAAGNALVASAVNYIGSGAPGQTSGIYLPPLSVDPVSPADGTGWYNSTTGEVKFRANGVTLIVGGPVTFPLYGNPFVSIETAGGDGVFAMTDGGAGDSRLANGGVNGSILLLRNNGEWTLEGGTNLSTAIGNISVGNINGVQGVRLLLETGANAFTVQIAPLLTTLKLSSSGVQIGYSSLQAVGFFGSAGATQFNLTNLIASDITALNALGGSGAIGTKLAALFTRLGNTSGYNLFTLV